MRGRLKFLPKCLLVWIVMIVIGVLWLMLGHAIPRSWMIENAQEAYEMYQSSGAYSSVTVGTFWDNWTDMYFVNTAVTEFDGNLLQKAIANACTCIGKLGGEDILASLDAALKGESGENIVLYSRYWAGNMTLYKILLIFTSMTGIRTILSIATCILSALAILCAYKQLGYRGVIPLLIVIAFYQFIPLSMCLAYSTDIILSLAAIILCTKFYKKADFHWKAYTILFGSIGTLCAYLGYWAFPIITVGVPLSYLAMLRIHDGEQEKTIFCDAIWLSVVWLCGVVATIGIKQVLCVIVLGSQTGVEEMLLRFGTHNINGRTWNVLYVFKNALTSHFIFEAACIILVLLLLLLIGYRKERIVGWTILFVSLYPVAWSFLFAGHMAHSFNIYMYIVSWYGLLCFLCLNLQKTRLVKKRERTNV